VARILNSVLISILAFFGFLGVFALTGLRGSEGGTPGQTTIARVATQWAGASTDGSAIQVTLTLANPGSEPVQAIRINHELVVSGMTFDQATVPLTQSVPGGKQGTVTYMANLDSRFVATWWQAHTQNGESSRLAVRGDLLVREGNLERHLPFEWTSEWQGRTTDLLSGLADCPQETQDVCLQSTSAHWDQGKLQAEIVLRNAGSFDLQVAGGSVTLAFGPETVAMATVPRTDLPAQGTATFEVSLSFDDAAMSRWWPSHVSSCESSPAQANLAVQLQEWDGWDAGAMAWRSPPATLRTAFLCEAPA